jgi:hypothetical protein
MSKLFIITHDLTATNPNPNFLFTFKGEGNRKIGEIVICQTKRGNRLGKIVDIIDEKLVDFTPTASIIKLNAGRKRNNLSAYDRATLIWVETQDEEQALSCFNGYSDKNAIIAFCYNELNADNVRFEDNWGCTSVEILYYETDGTYNIEYCFG